MNVFERLAASGKIEIADFEIDSFRPEDALHGSNIAIRVTPHVYYQTLSLTEILYLAVPEFVEYTFFHLDDSRRTAAITRWEGLLSDPMQAGAVVNSADKPMASIRVKLYFGASPVVGTSIQLQPADLPPYLVFFETAIEFFRWAYAQMDDRWKTRLRETLLFGMQTWKASRPKSTQRTWAWNTAWIDYPSWVQRATGEFSVKGNRAAHRYAKFTDSSVGISVEYPDFLRPKVGRATTNVGVNFVTSTGNDSLMIHRDFGVHFPTADPSLTPEIYLRKVHERVQQQMQLTRRDYMWIKEPVEAEFRDAVGWEAEFAYTEGGREQGRNLLAVRRINDSTFGRVLFGFPAENRWAFRDVFERVRSSLLFV